MVNYHKGSGRADNERYNLLEKAVVMQELVLQVTEISYSLKERYFFLVPASLLT